MSNLLFGQKKPRPSPLPTDDEGGDEGGGGHQARPTETPLTKPSPDRATPSLFATGKGATSNPSDPNITRKIRTKTAGGLTPRQYFGENKQLVKNKAKAKPVNLANPNSPINKILGPRLGRR